MPLYSRGEEKVYHIHIPKTAGRYINSLFLENNFFSEFDSVEKSIDGYEVLHLFYPLYNSLPICDVKNFTIVRNPLERFKSCLKNYLNHYNLQSDYFDRKDITMHDLSKIFYYETNICKSSFWMHQWRFISKKTFIWKYEDGFDDNFIEWLKLNLDIHLDRKIFKGQYNKMKFDTIDPIISKKVIELVEEYYKEDYEIFNY